MPRTPCVPLESGKCCLLYTSQMIKRIILPSALPGVMTGLILAMARGAGEVAPLMLSLIHI